MKTNAQVLPASAAMMRFYGAIAGTLVWFALILQFYLTTNLSIDKGLGLWVGTARYFGYFTILTNILVAIAFTVPLILPRSRWGQFFSQRRGENCDRCLYYGCWHLLLAVAQAHLESTRLATYSG